MRDFLLRDILRSGSVLLMFVACTVRADTVSSDMGDAKIQISNGGADVSTIIKIPGRECPTGVTKNCTAGKPCFSDIEISGDAAKGLWLLLRQHGIKNNDVLGEYVATSSEALTCWNNDGSYNCVIGYDPVKNSMTSFSYCDPE